ncbi:hypothetical protein [Caminibacter sp.]
MRKLFLILLMTIVSFASQYLPFILNAIKDNLKPPVKLSYGEIKKVEVEGQTTLVLYIHTTKKVEFQKKICRLPLFQDIIKEDGTVKYILDGKSTGEYVFNKEVCGGENIKKSIKK